MTSHSISNIRYSISNIQYPKFSTGVCSLIAAMLLAACHQEEKQTQATQDIPMVELTDVRSLQPSLQAVLPGELKPWNKAHLFPKVKGYVGSVLVDRGTVVKKGQVLATLEAPEMIATLNHVRAQVASAEATLIEQRAKQKVSRTSYSRIVETSQTPGAVAANELDVAYSRMLADSALARAAEENLHAAQAQFNAQNQLVNYLSVIAPFDGTITERNVSPGDLAGPETNTKPIFVLEDRSRLRLTVAVPENMSNSISTSSTVAFTLQADPLRQYSATFARSANTLQETSRSMMVEFDFDNRGGDLKAGMYAEVKLPVLRNKPTLFVPRSAVLHSTEGVFLVRVNNNAAEWVPVRQGNALDSLVEIFGTVQAGDRIVRRAHDELRNGQPVKTKS
jgi:membrane fusion protein, multidrug efflux system